MNRCFLLALLAILITVVSSCADHDDPKLAPIDTTQVKISADIKQSPEVSWFSLGEEMSIRVADVKMSAPKGVVLRSISLIVNNGNARYEVDEKPYSGETLEFKVPFSGLSGRLNFSLRANIIKKDCRDAEVIIADNIQAIVFSQEPKFECEGWLYVSVESRSTSGEEYVKSFEVQSNDHFSVSIPSSLLYWTPEEGVAPTIELTFGSGANVWSPNTTFNCKIVKKAIGHSTEGESTYKVTIPNIAGSLNAERLQLYVISSFFGTWENVTIDPYNVTDVFNIVETE